MRMLVYDCYYKDVKIKTVSTFSEAKKWKKQNEKNTYKERLPYWTNETKETDEEKEKRLAREKRKIEIIKNKIKGRKKTAVV